jgi:predicted MPP superfamily phosphohydrolase
MPDALDGLTITHLSDLHIGRLTTPEHLPGIMAICQKLQGDLIAITGDFIDLSQGVLGPVIDALKQLQAPLGVYLVPGNHDYLENGPKLVRRFRNAGLNLMMNKAAQLDYHGRTITIAGVDYAHQRTRRAALVRQTLAHSLQHGRSDLTILLAHHPDAFDEACKYGVDMTLSGHTHGGQLVFKHTQGKRGSIGLGAMAFKYPRGLYQRGQRHLHVTSGVGSWFPLRVQCPSEIVSLTLRTDGTPE